MRRLGDWLDDRHPAPPGELREAIHSLIAAEEGGEEPIHDRLATVALGELRRIAAEPSRRSAAPRLLAVDALLTYACEAAAEAGPDALEALTGRLDWARFEDLLQEVRG